MLIEFSKFSPDSGSQKRASDLTWPEFAIYKASRFDRMLGGFGSLLSTARLYKFTNCFFAHDNSHTESNFSELPCGCVPDLVSDVVSDFVSDLVSGMVSDMVSDMLSDSGVRFGIRFAFRCVFRRVFLACESPY